MAIINPINHADATVPPTLFICGTEDEFNLYPSNKAMAKKLKSLGVDTGLYAARGAEHGFDSRWGEPFSVEAVAVTAAWFDKYLK